MKRLAAGLLGLMICWELVFLPISNVWLLLPREQPALPAEILTQYQQRGRATSSDTLQTGIETVGKANDLWANATGQIPGWALFAPVVPEVGVLVELNFETTNGQFIEERSRYEPLDPKSYFRFDMSQNRIFNRLAMFGMTFEIWNAESYDKFAHHWKTSTNNQVLAFENSYVKYIRWHVREWEASHPGQAISRVKLGVRIFPTNKPGVEPARQTPVLVPVLLWDAQWPTVLKPYDPVTREYADLVRVER